MNEHLAIKHEVGKALKDLDSALAKATEANKAYSDLLKESYFAMKTLGDEKVPGVKVSEDKVPDVIERLRKDAHVRNEALLEQRIALRRMYGFSKEFPFDSLHEGLLVLRGRLQE